MLCPFLLNNSVGQLYVYIYAPPAHPSRSSQTLGILAATEVSLLLEPLVWQQGMHVCVYKCLYICLAMHVSLCDHVYLCACAQSNPTVCSPMDCRPSGSFAHGTLQARIRDWSGRLLHVHIYFKLNMSSYGCLLLCLVHYHLYHSGFLSSLICKFTLTGRRNLAFTICHPFT